MTKFTWNSDSIDPEIGNGVIVTILSDTTAKKLQTLIEFVSTLIDVKLDFRVVAGRYVVMCKKDDEKEVREKFPLLLEAIRSLQSIVGVS